jgi:hypothetical protein
MFTDDVSVKKKIMRVQTQRIHRLSNDSVRFLSTDTRVSVRQRLIIRRCVCFLLANGRKTCRKRVKKQLFRR